jgi:hypothetical protein
LQVLIEKQENSSKQMMEMNKTILDLKREVDTIKKTQSEATLVGISRMRQRPRIKEVPKNQWGCL